MKRLLTWLPVLAVCVVPRIEAAISVGANGSGVLTFDTAPVVTEWATATALPGGSGDIVTAAALDAAVQALSAASFITPLELTASTNPAPAVGLLARYNSAGRYLQSRSAGVAATVLMATLQNDTGADQFSLTVTYAFRAANPPFDTIAEQVPGLRTYFSHSGEPGTWQLIPELSDGNPGPLWARLPLMYWQPGTLLYLLWADDNSPFNPEGAYTLDDFSAYPGNIVFDPLSGVTIFSPVSGQNFPEGAIIDFSVYSTPGIGAVTNVLLYDGTNLVAQVATPPFPAILSVTNAAPGVRPFTAVGINSGVAISSAPVNVTVTAYRPPLTITDMGFSLAELSWPEAATGFELQSTTNLRSGPWRPVTEPDSIYGGFHHVQIFDPTNVLFFRLEKR